VLLADRRRLRGYFSGFHDSACDGCHFGQSEVENLGVSTLRYEDVCGLNVTVNDTFCVRCIERFSNLDSQ